MKRRALTIGLAVLLAIFGTTGVLVYVNHANARALAGQQAVNVLVAKSLIPAGTSAAAAQDQGLLTVERLPASSVPADALASVTSDVSALVTDADVQPGQLLVRPMLVTAAQATNGLAVPQGMVAVSIQFCLPEAVAGYIHPGSLVAVFDTTGSANMNAQPGCSGQHAWQSGNSVSTKLMLSKVTVLAVGQASTTSTTSTNQNGSTSGASPTLITLAVDTHDAAELIVMSEHDMPYLALMASS
jgi:pilus assembly protein CpaB